MSRLRRSLTYANVMATIAVFIALGGGAYAVSKAAKNSVVTKSIKNDAVTTKKIRDLAVDATKVNIPSLGLLATKQIVLRQNSRMVSSIPVDMNANITVDCQAGERAISGGAYTSHAAMAVSESWPASSDGVATGWVVNYVNDGSSDLSNVQVAAYVFCAPA
jgi:hypothetical protein